MELWIIWVTVGIICLIIEIFTPGFLFMSIGISAIITGLFSIIIAPIYWQVIIFILISFLLFINLRKISKKLISKDSKPTNVNALIGKTGFVTVQIPAEGRGYVKIGGEEWSAVSENNGLILEKNKVKIIAIEGNKVVVKELKEEKI